MAPATPLRQIAPASLVAEELDAEAALRLEFAQRSGDLAAAQAWARELAAMGRLDSRANRGEARKGQEPQQAHEGLPSVCGCCTSVLYDC